MEKARRRESETELYNAKPRVGLSIPFSAFWLRSSVVSVLISLISDTWPNGPHDIKFIFLGGEPTTVACYWASRASPMRCTKASAWRTPPKRKPKISSSSTMEIDLSKITLRPYKISDADDFLMYAGDDRVTRFTRWNTFTSKEDSLAYINDYCIPHPYCRSICIADRSIGFIIVVPGSGDDRCRADVGYALAAEYWGKGITGRAVKMGIAEGLKEFPEVVRFQALVELENKASQRVLEKLGFLREGVMRKYIFNKGQSRDIVMYSLLSTDPNTP